MRSLKDQRPLHHSLAAGGGQGDHSGDETAEGVASEGDARLRRRQPMHVTLRSAFALASLFFLLGAADLPLPLKLVKDAPFGPATRRFDYASLDQKTGLLFVADLAGSHVLVFDVRQERLVKTIDGVSSVHGVLAVPELGRVYASATGRDALAVVDEASLKVVASTPAGHYPDGIAWAPNVARLYISDEHGDSVAVIDAATSKLIEKIPLGGDVGNTQFDGGSGLIYSNEQTHDDMVAIDPRTDKVVSRHHLSDCRGAHGLLIDAPRRLAFIACENNARLVVFSLASHSQVSVTPIGKDPDVLAYDPSLRRLYVSSESGVISVFQVDDDGARKLGQGFLADNAHVVAVDLASHRVFFPLRKIDGSAMLRIMEPK
jgi:YVTN family beta-propeller protein